MKHVPWLYIKGFSSHIPAHWTSFLLSTCFSLTPTAGDLTNQAPNSGILHAFLNLVMLFNCLAFSKVTTFTCSFGAFNVGVSVFNMSFPGADVGGLGLVRTAEGAAWYHRSIHIRPSVIFSACQSLLDLAGRINESLVYPTGCRITGLTDLWQDVQQGLANTLRVCKKKNKQKKRELLTKSANATSPECGLALCVSVLSITICIYHRWTLGTWQPLLRH